MDNYGGYKLKPSSYSIQPNDIIIRVRHGISDMPNGQIAIALGKDCVKTHTQKSWSTYYPEWRAIETRPGSEAKVGDTVYCIKHTSGDCQVHDSFTVKDSKFSTFLTPPQGHKLLNEKIVRDNWSWPSNDFVVLVKDQKQQEDPTTKPLDLMEELVKSMFNETHTAQLQYSQNSTQTKPNTKGKQMNPNLFTDILKLLAQAEQTDLQKAPSTYAFFYNNEGEYEGTARVANEAEAKALLQKPEHLGYTMRIYSFSDEFTTQIPVVSTIKKTVVANPAAKPTRKPRAPKAS